MRTSTDIDQQTIDERIHHFMASKSPWKTLSKSIAERLAPAVRTKTASKGTIRYEPTDWIHAVPSKS